MSDIELVIKIPRRKFNTIKNKMYCGIYDSDLYKAIANGTPLPKGHGRLIDVSEYFKKEFGDAREFLDKATTIIEADKVKSGDKE